MTEKAKESIKDSDGFLIPSLPGMMAPPQAKKAKGKLIRQFFKLIKFILNLKIQAKM